MQERNILFWILDSIFRFFQLFSGQEQEIEIFLIDTQELTKVKGPITFNELDERFGKGNWTLTV